MKSLYKIILLTITLCLSSCLDDLDYEQAEDFEIEPEVVVSLLNFDLTQNELVLANISEPPTVIEDQVLLPSFKNAIVQDDLEILGLEFELSNSFDASFTIDVVFWDELKEETYTVTSIEVPANTELFTYAEDIVILNNPSFLNSYEVSVKITYNGGEINEDIEANLIFKSAALLYF